MHGEDQQHTGNTWKAQLENISKNEMQKGKEKKVKAVMFVPYTPGSELAKRLRKAEEMIQDMTGYRLKIVERAGLKLQDALTKADPWQGMNCDRDGCLLCLTKTRTGKNTTQDCTRRSLVYKTWCITCYEKDLETVKTEAGDNMEKLKTLTEKMKIYKYIGETGRSTFERSWEHMNDFRTLSTKSHLLKHAVDKHENENLKELNFSIKVLKYTRTAFERQIYEAVTIEENRHHNLLNSSSDFNRSAMPRLTCKLGDKSYQKYEQEVDRDMEKEEGQVTKIRELIKERNRTRAQNQRKLPPPKRRKLEGGKYEQATLEKQTPEKETREDHRRQEELQEGSPPTKRQDRRAQRDIREALGTIEKSRDKPSMQQDQPAQQEHEQEQETDSYGQEAAEGELVDWATIFKAHMEETRRMNREREEKIEKAQKKEKSWELLRECTNYLKENEKAWKQEQNKYCKEAKSTRLRRAENKRKETLTKIRQQKIQETLKKLPEMEKKRLKQEKTEQED